jgi:hypothetical protein
MAASGLGGLALGSLLGGGLGGHGLGGFGGGGYPMGGGGYGGGGYDDGSGMMPGEFAAESGPPMVSLGRCDDRTRCGMELELICFCFLWHVYLRSC